METNTIILLAGLSILLFIPGLIYARNFIVYRQFIPRSLHTLELFSWLVYDIFSGIMGGLSIFSYFFYPKEISSSLIVIIFTIIGVIALTLAICLIWKSIYKRASPRRAQRAAESRQRLHELAYEIPCPPPPGMYSEKEYKISDDGKIVYL